LIIKILLGIKAPQNTGTVMYQIILRKHPTDFFYFFTLNLISLSAECKKTSQS